MACNCGQRASSSPRAATPVVYSVWSGDVEVDQFDDLETARQFAKVNGGTVRVRNVSR